jgi:hypothetical protein
MKYRGICKYGHFRWQTAFWLRGRRYHFRLHSNDDWWTCTIEVKI